MYRIYSAYFRKTKRRETMEIRGLQQDLDVFIEEQMKLWKLPGLALAVVRDGEVIISRGYGYRDVAKKSPVDENTIFAIGSSTKAFAATTLGMLVEEGKLEWDTPIQDYYPEFRLKDPVVSQRITLRDLLCHRSGLPSHDFQWYNTSLSRAEIIERLRYLEPSKDFRTHWQYQNHMYFAAGCLAEKVTGETWEDLVQKRILTELDMMSTNSSIPESIASGNYALPYAEKEGKAVEIPFRDISIIGAAGAVNSNVKDMAKWVGLQLSRGEHGGKQLITPKTLDEIQSPQMTMHPGARAAYNADVPETPHVSYGMGWFIQPYRGLNTIHHGGAIDGFTAMVSFMPEKNIGLVILTNLNSNPVPIILSYRVYDILLGLKAVDWSGRMQEKWEEFKKAQAIGEADLEAQRIPNAPTSHPLEDFVGDYEDSGYGIASVRLQEGQLVILHNGINHSLSHYHHNVFLSQPELFPIIRHITFTYNQAGKINCLHFPLEPMVKEIKFYRKGLIETKN